MKRNKVNKEELAGMIDHTLLNRDATYKDIKLCCCEAEEHRFASVAIHQVNVPLVARLLKDSGVKVDSTVGFYTGAYPTDLKVFETKDAIEKGADEIDFVIDIASLKSERYDRVGGEMKAIKEVAGERITKAILSTAVLTKEEIRKACELAKEAKIDFVKTSTGFREKGATVEDVKLMKGVVGEKVGVKASGGIRSSDDALSMIEAGASRIGTSSGVQIIEGFGKST